MAEKRWASPSPDQPKRRRLASPTSSSSVPPNLTTAEQLEFHRTLQDTALQSVVTLRDQLFALEVEGQRVDKEVASLEEDHKEAADEMMATLEAMNEMSTQAARMTADSTRLVGDINDIASDASSLLQRLTTYTRACIFPHFCFEPLAPTMVLVLPTDTYDAIPKTVEALQSHDLFDNLFTTVQLTPEKIESAEADFAELCEEGAQGSMATLIESWADVLAFLHPTNSTQWLDAELPSEERLQAQEDLPPSTFDMPKHMILGVQGANRADNPDEHDTLATERMYVHGTLSDNWTLCYNLGEPGVGVPVSPKWLPKHYLNPDPGCAFDAPTPRAESLDYLSLLSPDDGKPLAPPSMIECTSVLSTLRGNVSCLLRAVAVDQLTRMKQTMSTLRALTERAATSRAQSDMSQEWELELYQQLVEKKKRAWALRKMRRQKKEELMEEILMLVILSKGP